MSIFTFDFFLSSEIDIDKMIIKTDMYQPVYYIEHIYEKDGMRVKYILTKDYLIYKHDGIDLKNSNNYFKSLSKNVNKIINYKMVVYSDDPNIIIDLI